MKAITIILPLFILSIFTFSCGKKKKVPVSIKFNTANISAGIINYGGIILSAKNITTGHYFSVGISDPHANHDISLSYGTWKFIAIGWDGGAPFKGTNRCGLKEIDLVQNEQEVVMDLNVGNCSLPAFVSSPSYYHDDGHPYQFKNWYLLSCSNLSGNLVQTDDCAASSAHKRRPGVSHSFRISFVGRNSDPNGPRLPTLYSQCIKKTAGNSIKGHKFTVGQKIPLGSPHFIFTITGYEDFNCQKSDSQYIFQNGIGAAFSHTAAKVFASTTTAKVFLADNYSGAESSPLIDLVPYMDNNFLPATTEVIYQTGSMMSNALERLADLIGTPDNRAIYDLEKQASNTDTSIIVKYITPGKWGNSYTVDFTHMSSHPNVSHTPTTNGVEIVYDSAAHTYNDIIAHINDPNGPSQIEAVLKAGASGADAATSIVGLSIQLEDGRSASTDDRRNHGAIGEAASFFGSDWMGLMYKRGYTTCDSIINATSGTVEDFSFDEYHEAFRIEIHNSTETIPRGMTGETIYFQKNIRVYANGKLEASAHFNCPDPGNHHKVAKLYFSHHDDLDPEQNATEFVYDLTNPDLAKIEIINYHKRYENLILKKWKSVTRFDSLSSIRYRLWSTQMDIDTINPDNNHNTAFSAHGARDSYHLYLKGHHVMGDLSPYLPGSYNEPLMANLTSPFPGSNQECYQASTHTLLDPTDCTSTPALSFLDRPIIDGSDYNYSKQLVNFSFEELDTKIPLSLIQN